MSHILIDIFHNLCFNNYLRVSHKLKSYEKNNSNSTFYTAYFFRSSQVQRPDENRFKR